MHYPAISISIGTAIFSRISYSSTTRMRTITSYSFTESGLIQNYSENRQLIAFDYAQAPRHTGECWRDCLRLRSGTAGTSRGEGPYSSYTKTIPSPFLNRVIPLLHYREGDYMNLFILRFPEIQFRLHPQPAFGAGICCL